MTLLHQIQSRYRNELLPRLPGPLRELLQGNSFRQLLQGVESELLLFGDTLFDLHLGQTAIVDTGEESQSEMDPQQIAGAASRLAKKGTAVVLYLSPAEFVGTQYKLPGMSREAAQSALGLQSEALFPGVEQELSIAVAGNLSSEDDAVALWLANERLDALFAAFEAQGLFLVAVAPRVLAISDGAVVDSDSEGNTLALIAGGNVSRYLYIVSLDLQDEPLRQEFDEAVARYEEADLLRASTGSDYFAYRQEQAGSTAPEPGAEAGKQSPSVPAHVFIPAAAMQAREKVEQRRNLLTIGALCFIALSLGLSPFAAQSIEFRRYAAVLENNREMSVEARQNQAAVAAFEDEWGLILDFPEHDITEAMFNLQKLLLPDQLSSLEVSEGLIRIQGTSAEPQGILQRLEQDPMFTDVVFSRATSNNRYYIDLRLSETNFEAYRLRYFPE